MGQNVRIITINMCDEFSGKKTLLLNKWVLILSKIKADILFLQEVTSYNIESLSNSLGLKILNINDSEDTSILINQNSLLKPHKVSWGGIDLSRVIFFLVLCLHTPHQ